MEYQPISVGIITIQSREIALEKLLTHLKESVVNYPGKYGLVICNSSNQSYVSQINEIVGTTSVCDFCAVRVLQSSESNVGVEKNVLENMRPA